jgi:hypothetical protein
MAKSVMTKLSKIWRNSDNVDDKNASCLISRMDWKHEPSEQMNVRSWKLSKRVVGDR